MAKLTVKKYVEKYLATELRAIQISGRVNELPELDDYEKAVIYKYTNDGYESLNEYLRVHNGQNTNQLGIFLETALRKLPDYLGVVFRGVHLSRHEINRYQNAQLTNSQICEISFLSASISFTIANSVPGINCLFVLNSKKGKAIEKIAKFRLYNPPNEQEVLFLCSTEFRILGMTKEPGYIMITMEEL
jgi:hypothetical protein